MAAGVPGQQGQDLYASTRRSLAPLGFQLKPTEAKRPAAPAASQLSRDCVGFRVVCVDLKAAARLEIAENQAQQHKGRGRTRCLAYRFGAGRSAQRAPSLKLQHRSDGDIALQVPSLPRRAGALHRYQWQASSGARTRAYSRPFCQQGTAGGSSTIWAQPDRHRQQDGLRSPAAQLAGFGVGLAAAATLFLAGKLAAGAF